MIIITDNPEKHEAALQLVRDLSEHRLTREPNFVYIPPKEHYERVRFADIEEMDAVALSRQAERRARKLLDQSPYRRVRH